ncbi:DinB family protein [Candidatus Bipolaricaulota bacterium]|nr:DinB family protein [Candidatus Bipolaricaulota bacterium]
MNERILRDQLVSQLEGGQAYLPVAKIFEGFPTGHAGVRIDGIRHTPWELLEHLRIAQWDILFFTLDPNHVTPPWPEEHWPTAEAPNSDEDWSASVSVFLSELDQVKALARDPMIPLFEKIPHGSGQTYLREILLVAAHNAHHLGQLLMLRRALEK